MVTQPSEAYFDTSGKKIKEGPAPHAIGMPAALLAALGIPTEAPRHLKDFTASETATACLELHSGPTVINIQITADLTYHSQTSPYTILGASFGGDICTSPGPGATQWQVNLGYIGRPWLFLFAQRVPPGNAPQEAAMAVGTCADGISIIGGYKEPSTYTGIYGFLGESIWSHDHTTLFKGWQPCS
jgi:hypothetical protein